MSKLIDALADLWKVIEEMEEAIDGLNEELEKFEDGDTDS